MNGITSEEEEESKSFELGLAPGHQILFPWWIFFRQMGEIGPFQEAEKFFCWGSEEFPLAKPKRALAEG